MEKRENWILPLKYVMHYGLQDSSILDDRILVDDNDPIVDGVHRIIAFLSGDVIDTNPAPVSDASILVNDSPADDRAPSDADVGNPTLGILSLLLLGLVVGGTHAVDTIEGSSGFNQGTNTDD
ncbi:hypothetical protein SDC9_118454 [bioreactor metagenome]|uniref:Uncharacterized protein n=1 Tax=bioreactor metagenome TaxID=1076179 RepID=A0A645C1H7_9ZZZZ